MKISTLLTTLFLAFGLGTLSYGQQKIAFINSDSIFRMMPEADTAAKQLEAYQKPLVEALEKMQSDYEKMLQEYETNRDRWAPSIRELKENDIMAMQRKMQDFEKKAQGDLQKKQQELFKPILDKARDAIQTVAKEKGYSMVLDNSTGVLLYSLPADDLFDPVKKKLGIK